MTPDPTKKTSKVRKHFDIRAIGEKPRLLALFSALPGWGETLVKVFLG